MTVSTAYCSVASLTDYDNNNDKYYRVYAIGNWSVFQWGARGTVGQFQAKQHSSPAAARDAANSKLQSKIREGYSDLIEDIFQADPTLLDGSKTRCVQLDDIRQAAGVGNPAPLPVFAGQPLPAVVSRDPYGEFTDRALAAITLAVTDPRKGAEEYALLNAAWPELEQIHNKARSYLNTLDSLVIGVTA